MLLAPPCTLFTTLVHLSMQRRHTDRQSFEKYLKELRDARRLLKFCTEIYELCHELGLTYVFEHPWGASSWQEICLYKLVLRDDTFLARVDQCQFGLNSSQNMPMRKHSGFLTNDQDMAIMLNRTCTGQHSHEQIIGRAQGDPTNRSAMAQKYPLALIGSILACYAQKAGIFQKELQLIDATHIATQDQQFVNQFREFGCLMLTKDDDAFNQPRVWPILAEVSDPADDREPAEDSTAGDEEQIERSSFPGSHPLSLQALVKRAHEGLGHPGKERFLRILKSSKASDQVMEIARNLKCAVCEKFKRPQASRAGAPPREIGLNEVIGIDSIQVRAPFSQKTKYCLNVVDYHSHFQLVIPLTGHTAREARDGYRLWVKIFRPPRKVLCDLGKEFLKEFTDTAEADGSEVISSGLETPKQRGFVERHGQLFKDMFYKTIEQMQCRDWNEWFRTIDTVCHMKNRLTSRGGYSPAQRVFGYQQRLPGGMMSDGIADLSVVSRAQAGDIGVEKAMFIRKEAAKAFHETDCSQAVRAAATHGPRPFYDFQVGQAVFFWRRGTEPSRKPANAFWHGPARVVAIQLPTTVWVAYNRHLVKVAPEKLRLASDEEFFSLSGWLEGISNAKKQFESEDLKGLIDLSKDSDQPGPPAGSDFWVQDGLQWIRIHEVPREALFHPEDLPPEDLPFQIEELDGWRRVIMHTSDGQSYDEVIP